MSKTINDLKYSIGGGAKTNKFEVIIEKPILVSSMDNDKNVEKTKIPLLVSSTNLPEKNISVVNVMHRGRKFPIRDVGNFTDQWSCTFYNDDKLAIRSYFEDWMYNIDRIDNFFTMDSYIQNNMFLGYMQDIKVNQLDGMGNIVASYILYHAFPSNLDSIALNSEEKSVISKSTVTFTYSYWRRENAPNAIKQATSIISNTIKDPKNTVMGIIKGLF